MVTVYRIFFRKPKGASWGTSFPEQLAEGEVARDRILARPRPKAIHWEVALIHECEVCHARRPWEDGWRWFGSQDDLEAGRPIRKFCSDLCRPVDLIRTKRPESMSYHDWPHLSQFEPDPSGAVIERWKILREVGDPNAHRKVPMPKWPGPGVCRWCLEPTIVESGKRIGLSAPGRNWHNACYYQYQLHTELAVQFKFLFERDGPRCQICDAGGYASAGEFSSRPAGMTWAEFYRTDKSELPRLTHLKPSIKLEVDHVIPLWKVAMLYPRRREFYGPVNLWLLCEACHKSKSADEAAERAAVKRSTACEGAP